MWPCMQATWLMSVTSINGELWSQHDSGTAPSVRSCCLMMSQQLAAERSNVAYSLTILQFPGSSLPLFRPRLAGCCATEGALWVRAESPFVVEASFAPCGQVLLQPAAWTLAWEFIELARDVVAEHVRGSKFTPPLDQEEIAYFDAVATNESAVDVMGEGVLADIAASLSP